MLIWHGAMAAGELLLWAEGAPVSSAPSRGRWASKPPAPGFGLAAGPLATAVAEVFPFLTSQAARSGTAWLPSAGDKALPSSPLLGTAATAAEPVLRPYTVAVMALDIPAAAFLLDAVDRGALGEGDLAAADLRHLAAVLHLARSLVARERFYPSLRAEDKSYRAVWTLLPGPEDRQRLRELAAVLPGSARAFGTATEPPTVPSARLLEVFLALLVDYLVRSAFKEDSVGLGDSTPQARWLQALGSPTGLLGGRVAEISALAQRVAEWSMPLSIHRDEAFRLTFRLEEPAAADDPWRVTYHLQSADDPSLLVAADTIWQARGRAAAQLAKLVPAARESLLSELGRASRVLPELEEGLRSPHPAEHTLDEVGAHRFLTETAWLLEEERFGVLLPKWWNRQGPRPSLSARVRAFPAGGGSPMGLNSLVDFAWEVALGEESLTREELLALAELKSPLVRLRGRWVEVDSQTLRQAIAALAGPGGQVSLGELFRQSAGQGTVGGLPVSEVRAEGQLGELLAQLQGRAEFSELPTPEAFQGTLRPYQSRGFSWLHFLKTWGLGGCLADDMGLGKTVQTLALLQADHPENRRPTLLVSPTSVVGNWQREAERFAPALPVLVHHGAERLRAGEFSEAAARSALVIVSYGLLLRDQELLKGVAWRGIVLDEAQYVKNAETKLAKAARSLTADYRFALTGTPVENNVGELWSLMDWLNPGLLGSRADFQRRFFLPIQRSQDPEALRQLRRLTEPFLLRRLKSDPQIIDDLPAKLEMKVFCPITPEQASLYAAVVRELEAEVDQAEGMKRRGLVLAALSKLKQVCNHPAQFLGDNSGVAGRSGKLARLEEMLAETLAVDDRSLIFTQFTRMGELLRDRLQERFGREVLFLHGGVSQRERMRLIDRFQEEPSGPPILILSLKAGGTGLNLTRANHVFHFDRWWNPAVENQATDRAYRIGQKNRVQVHKFVCQGTLEERIDRMIEDKREIAEQVIGSGEKWLTELSTRELRELLALSSEAVED